MRYAALLLLACVGVGLAAGCRGARPAESPAAVVRDGGAAAGCVTSSTRMAATPPAANDRVDGEFMPTRPASAELVDLEAGPIVTFEQACARCHGPQGSFYGETFADLEDPELEKFVIEMMEGPAQLRPSEADEEAMIAYHRGLRDAGMFVVVTNAASFAAGDGPLRGEVTPGATVEIHKDGRVIPADVQDLTWTVTDPPAPPFTVVARKDSQTAEFPFPDRQWSGRAG